MERYLQRGYRYQYSGQVGTWNVWREEGSSAREMDGRVEGAQAGGRDMAMECMYSMTAAGQRSGLRGRRCCRGWYLGGMYGKVLARGTEYCVS